VGSIAAYATLGLARLALAEGRADAARALLEPVTTISPRFGPAFRLLGSAYAALGRSSDAERMVRQADRLPAYDPYVDPFNDRLARESRSATFLLQQASATDATTSGAWREYLIRRAIEVDPENQDAPVELAALLRAERRYEEALEVLERYRRDVPGDYQALADIGRCLSGLQRYTEAEGVLRRALDGLDDANTRYDLGLVLDRTGRVPEAVAEYERALARNPNHRDALNNLAVDLARLNRTAEAVRPLEHLLSIEPDNVDARVNLGLLRLAQHQRAQAEAEFRRVLSTDPQNARALAGLRTVERAPEGRR
jgi:tetratricopeptide (TPR) repeat protein